MFRLDARMVGAHQASFQLYVGPIPAGHYVLHHCDVKLCVRPDHLWTGTQRENLADMDAKGRRVPGGVPQRGELNHSSKLTSQIVAEIRRRHSAGERQTDIARDMGVTKANVWAVVHRKSWTHVP